MDPKKGEVIEPPKVYNWRDLLNFENKNRYTSIGK